MGALPEFHVRVSHRGRTRVAEVEGEIDVLTAPQLGAAVDDEEAYEDLVLDLSQAPFMSSVGLGLLTTIHRRQVRRGFGLALAAVPPDVLHLLEITGLIYVLTIEGYVNSAIYRLRGGGYY